MKTRLLVLVSCSLFMVQAVLAGTATNCVSRPDVGDGSGGFITGFDCTFYHEASVYPFDLTPFITYGGASLSENEIYPAGYLVWTTDVSDYTNQTLNDAAAFKDMLDFDANLGGIASSQVYVYWPAITFPSVGTIQGEGYFVLPYSPSGVQFYDPGDGNHTYTVNDTLPGVPEPSTLLLVFAGGLGTLILRRRRC